MHLSFDLNAVDHLLELHDHRAAPDIVDVRDGEVRDVRISELIKAGIGSQVSARRRILGHGQNCPRGVCATARELCPQRRQTCRRALR